MFDGLMTLISNMGLGFSIEILSVLVAFSTDVDYLNSSGQGHFGLASAHNNGVLGGSSMCLQAVTMWHSMIPFQGFQQPTAARRLHRSSNLLYVLCWLLSSWHKTTLP